MIKKTLLKTTSILTLAMTISTFSPSLANAAWKSNSTGWWYTEGNSYATGWRLISGTWYFFDANGYMKTGWVKDGGSWYYMNNSGAMMTGWVKDGGSWYYMNNSGVMQTGWVNVGGYWYYMSSSGVMQTGLIYDGYNVYYLYDNGVMSRNEWFHDDSYNFYLTGPSGAIVTGFHKHIDGYTYCFGQDGKLITNSIVDGYFIDQDGIVSNKVNNIYDDATLQNIIRKEDSEFIKSFESNYSNGKAEFTTAGIFKSSYLLEGYNTIDNELVYFVLLHNAEDFDSFESAVYLVGEKSGKVYRTTDNVGNYIYEVKNNQVVNTHKYNSYAKSSVDFSSFIKDIVK